MGTGDGGGDRRGLPTRRTGKVRGDDQIPGGAATKDGDLSIPGSPHPYFDPHSPHGHPEKAQILLRFGRGRTYLGFLSVELDACTERKGGKQADKRMNHRGSLV
jgi:hypothetical protein